MAEFVANVIIRAEVPIRADRLPRQSLEKALEEALEHYCALPVHSVYIDTFYRVNTAPMPADSDI